MSQLCEELKYLASRNAASKLINAMPGHKQTSNSATVGGGGGVTTTVTTAASLQSATNQDLSPQQSVFGSLKVDLNSQTPYTDATQCKKVTNHIKRPMNAFMVSVFYEG